MLALLPHAMIETAFLHFSQSFLRYKESNTFSEVSVTLRPMARAQIGPNDFDFLKEFSCYV